MHLSGPGEVVDLAAVPCPKCGRANMAIAVDEPADFEMEPLTRYMRWRKPGDPPGEWKYLDLGIKK